MSDEHTNDRPTPPHARRNHPAMGWALPVNRPAGALAVAGLWAVDRACPGRDHPGVATDLRAAKTGSACRSPSRAQGHIPLGVGLLLAAVGGVLIVATLGTGRILQLRRTTRRRCRPPH